MTADPARRRLHRQGLATPRFERVEDVVQWLGAVQAQDFGGAKWAVAQRTAGATEAAVEEAFNEGRILRTHVLRPTWHFVVPADIRWMLALSAPRVHAALGSYNRKLGLDAGVFARSRAVLAKALAGGRQLRRQELAAALGRARVAGGDAMTVNHLLVRAELEGVICSGALRGKQHTYALLEERVPETAPVARDAALGMLARRFFASHGPATVADFAWWSGLTITDARAGLATVGEEELASGTAGGAPCVRLLPNFDEYIVAYADRSTVYDSRHANDFGARGSVLFTNTIVVDGRVAGTWKRTLTTRAVTVHTTLFRRLTKPEMAGLDGAVERYGAFLGRPVGVRQVIAK